MNLVLLVFQILTGNLVGTAVDETSGVLPGASVTISSPALPSGPSATVTDEKGRFRFPALPPGVYRLSVELSGFRSYSEEGLRLSLGATLEREVTLALASVAETVNVSDESPLLDATEAGYSTNYGSEYAENLPLHRDSFFDLIKSAPGMSAALPGNEGGQVSAFGSSSNENLYLVDGTDFTGRSGGNAAIWLDPDVVGEVEIVGLGASVEYGEFQGAVFNVVSKSGGSEFRFDASYYGEFDSLTSQPIRYPCNCPEGETGYVRSKYRDFSTHVGGPLWKDRMWFFGGYQYRTDSDNFPGGDGPPSVEDDHRVFAKVNWQITPNLKLMANYQNDYWGYVDPSTVSRPYEVLNRQEGHDPAATFFHLTHLVSDRTLWEARVSGSYPSALWTSASGSTLPYHYDGLTGYESGGPFLVGPGEYPRTDARGKLSHYATDFLGGDHDFKFGVQLGRADSVDVSVLSSGAGVYYYDYGGYPFYAVFREPYVYGGASKSLGIFAEDTVRLGERLSVNLGLRYDHTWSISQDLPAVDHLGQETGAVIEGNGDVYLWSELSPRIGFSYKLTGDGKTLVRASWGRYRQGVFLRETAATHPGQTPTTTANFDPATGEYSDVVSVVDPTEQLGIDPQTKGPVTDQFSIGFDREVAKGVAVSATYARKNGSDFIAWKDIAGIYEPAIRVLPDGREIEVQALIEPARRSVLPSEQPRRALPPVRRSHAHVREALVEPLAGHGFLHGVRGGRDSAQPSLSGLGSEQLDLRVQAVRPGPERLPQCWRESQQRSHPHAEDPGLVRDPERRNPRGREPAVRLRTTLGRERLRELAPGRSPGPDRDPGNEATLLSDLHRPAALQDFSIPAGRQGGNPRRPLQSRERHRRDRPSEQQSLRPELRPYRTPSCCRSGSCWG